MASRLYVGNLPYNFSSQDLQQLFSQHGGVRSCEVIMDRETGRSRGFGFVEMESEAASQQAIAALHEKDVGGRRMTVNEARERTPRGPGGPRPGGPGGPGGPSGSGGSWGGAGGGSGAPRGPGGGFGPPSGGFGAPRGGPPRDRGERRERGDRYTDGGGRGRRRPEDDDG